MGAWKLIVQNARGDTGNDVLEDEAEPTAPGCGLVGLFQIAADPYEKRDLASSHPQKVAELGARYQELSRQAIPPKSAPKAAGFRLPRVGSEPD